MKYILCFLAICMVVSISGCACQNVKLQTTPYTDNSGQYRVPLDGKLKINMLPNEFISVLWCNLDLFHIDFIGKTPKNTKEYKFELSPTIDEFQEVLKKDSGLSDVLKFDPVNITLFKNEPAVAKISGVATRIKINVTNSSSLNKGITVTELEIDFDQALWRSLIAKHGIVKKDKNGNCKLSWEIKTPVNEKQEYENKKSEISLGEPLLISDEIAVDSLNNCIMVPVKKIVWADCYQEFLIQKIEETWPARLKKIDYLGGRIESESKIEKIVVGQNRDGGIVENGEMIKYSLFLDKGTGFENNPVKNGAIKVKNSKCTFRLRDILDIGLNARNVKVIFTKDESTVEYIISRVIFLKLAQKD